MHGAATLYREWFTTSARLRAEQVVPLDEQLAPGCFAVLDPQFPLSYDSNRIVLPGVPDGLTPDAAVAVADEVLAGHGHREVSVYDDVPADWRRMLAALPAEEQRVVGMVAGLDAIDPAVHAGGAATSADGVALSDGARVVRLTESEAAPFVAAQWRADQPGFDAETVRQLVERRVRMPRAGEVHLFGVAVPEHERAAAEGSGGLAAQLDLVVRGHTAELDAVGVLGPYRRRGYGDALIAAAMRTARSAGARHVVLEALADDWPREWYARRGFSEVARASGFTWRRP